MLVANPPPIEPDSTVPSPERGFAFRDAHKLDQFLEVELANFGNLDFFMGFDAEGKNGSKLNIGGGHITGFNTVDGVEHGSGDWAAYDSSFAVDHAVWRFEFTLDQRMRVYAKRPGDDTFTFLSGLTGRMNQPKGPFIRVGLAWAPGGTLIYNAKAGPIGLANNPLVVTTPVFNRDTRTVQATVAYYVPTDDVLQAQIEDKSGTVVSAFAPVKIMANPTAGTAVVETTGVVPANKEGSDFNVRYQFKEATAVRAVASSYFPGKASWGSNAQQPNLAYNMKRCAYTNLAFGGYWQNWGGPDGFAMLNARDSTNKLDANGMPLVPGIALHCGMPPINPRETATIEVTWTGGDMAFSPYPSTGGWSAGPQTRVDAHTIEFDVTVDSEDPTADNTLFTLVFDKIDAANPPKDLFICIKGADKTKRFDPAYIEFQKTFDGPIRFMDWFPAMEPYDAARPENRGWDGRARRSVIGHQFDHVCYEDMIELSQLTNRSVWINPSLAVTQSPEGLDKLSRMMRMFDTGEDAEGITGGVPAGKQIHCEVGNENWSFGNQNAHYAADVARSIVPFADNDGGAKYGAHLIGRLLCQQIFAKTIREAIPAWETRVVQELGLQMGNADLQNLVGQGRYLGTYWEDTAPYIDRCAKAPYLPADPNVTGIGTKPLSNSPKDVVAWLSASLQQLIVKINDERQFNSLFGFATDLYEWNIARPAIDRNREDEFNWLTSPEFFAFMRDEYMPVIASLGSDTCVYMDTGNYGGGQQWDVDTGPGSSANALIDGMRAYLGQPVSRTYAHGPTPKAAAVLSGDPAGNDFAVTPAVWPADTEVMYRVVTTNGDKGFRLSGDTFQRGGRKAGDVIAFYELARLDGGWTYGHSNKITLT